MGLLTTIDYQNIFTRVQVRGPDDLGVPIAKGIYERGTKASHNYWFGKIEFERRLERG